MGDFLEFLAFLGNNPGLPAPLIQPPAVGRLLRSKACRSAIKFGDALSRDACMQLVRDLADTDMPFQCAHGRPSVFPIALPRNLLSDRRKKIDELYEIL
jgi:DNA mismatch repair protein MLH3